MMDTPQLFTFSHVLSLANLHHLRTLLLQLAQDLEAVVLTETDVSATGLAQLSNPQFVLVASEPFSALLQIAPITHAEATAQSAHTTDPIYPVDLTFEPGAIALFLDQLDRWVPVQPYIRQKATQARSLLRPNNAQIQSDFTLKLITTLTAEATAQPADTPAIMLASATEAALRQQVEQEQLLNQVTRQIRQSLELPVILKTAVEQVRQCLQVDRLVIYQLDTQPATLSPLASEFLSTVVAEPDFPLRNSGSVVYEARESDAIPSVLNFSDAYCLTEALRRRDWQELDLSLAIEDVELKYAATPCLLEFLRQAKVRAKLVAPIWVHNRLWGLLIAHECLMPRRWQDSEQRFLRQIAEHLAIAIYQAQLFAEVQQQKQTLEQQVIRRTQDLHDALSAAQSANRAKSEFLAIVSHELRTPLACIIGMSATLQRWSGEILNERQRNFLQAIHDSGEHLLSLINDILDLSQAEAGKVILNVREFSLSRLAQQTLKTFEGQAALANVGLELDVRVDPMRDRFTADPRRVRQILFNLIGNAVKFTSEGGKVTLRVFAEENLAILQVKDTGIGIPEHELPLLFQKFQQLDTGYQRQYQGTGLGLALTKQLVELHGGSVEVESTVGIGSVFTVRLPQQRIAPDGTALKTRITSAAEPRGRIVLIEHQEESANFICDVLTAAGYQVVWILEGSTAVSQIEVLRPFAVITNAQLPDIDSYNLIHSLRQNPITKNLLIVAITSATQQGQDWTEIGVDDYLVHPVRPDQLLQRVAALSPLSTGNQDQSS